MHIVSPIENVIDESSGMVKDISKFYSFILSIFPPATTPSPKVVAQKL
jgi:hypothetical protein